MPDASLVTKEALGEILGFLSDGEKETLRGHGLFVPLTRLMVKTKCGCTPGCNHPGSWQYENIALLSEHSSVRKVTQQTWTFQPPVSLLSNGVTVTLPAVTMKMTAEKTQLIAQGNVVWECRGASYHFVSLFVTRGYDVVVGKQVRNMNPLRNLYSALLDSKRDSGFTVPYCSNGVGAEFPPVLLFDDVSTGRMPCVSCSLSKITHHWSTPFTRRLSDAKEYIKGNAEFGELEKHIGLPLMSAKTNTLLSAANQGADIIAQAIEWGAERFLQRLVGTVDFTPSNGFSGCPIYFFCEVLHALRGCRRPGIVRIVLSMLPHGVFPLTDGCISRDERYSLVEDAINDFVAEAAKDAEILAATECCHLHVYHTEGDECSWCLSMG